MKTQIIRFKGYELVNICDMTFNQFMALCSCLQTSEASNCKRVSGLAKELHDTTHWRFEWDTDWQNSTWSLVILTWEDVMILSAILSDEWDRLKTVPMNHWYKEAAQLKIEHISKILDVLNVTFAARVDE